MEENTVLAPEEEATQDRGDAFLEGLEDDPAEGSASRDEEERGESTADAAAQRPEARNADERAGGENVHAPGEKTPGEPPRETAAAKRARQSDGDEMMQDIAQFAEVFPELYDQARKDASLIPESVWQEVGAGKSLATAYAKYAVEQAAAQAQAATQSQKNAQRATGSMRSAGSDAKSKDPFLAGWEE